MEIEWLERISGFNPQPPNQKKKKKKKQRRKNELMLIFAAAMYVPKFWLRIQ